jgi:hypothetical protein
MKRNAGLLFSKRPLFFWLIVLLAIIIVVLAISQRRAVSPQHAAVERAVRATFPRLCGGSTFHIQPAPLDSHEVWVGCESNWDQFGPALSVNPATCHFQVMSLTLASELGDWSVLNSTLLDCSPESSP